MVFNRSFNILDEVCINREEMHVFLRIRFHNHSQRDISSFPVADLELFANDRATTRIYFTFSGYITPSAKFRTGTKGDMASRLQHQVSVRAIRNRLHWLACLTSLHTSYLQCTQYLHIHSACKGQCAECIWRVVRTG